MKTLLTSVLAMFVSLSAFAGIPYVISPTNTPALGMQLFSGGPAGVNYWDWATNSAGSNSTVVSASASIGITTNGFNFTPFLSAQVTNWITGQDTVVSNGVYGLFNGGTNITFGYARSLSAADTNNDTVVSNGVYGLFNGGTNITFGYARSLSAADTNNDTVVSNGVYGLFNGGTNLTFGYARSIGGFATNNDTVVSNGVFGQLNTGTNDAFAYARSVVGVGATNQDLKTSNTLWLTITNNYLAAGDSSVTITTNRSGQNLVWSIISNAGGSGTGIQTNGGSGTNNIFSSPTLQGAPGSTDSNILYIVYGITNWVFRTNGDLVNLGSGKLFTLLSNTANTNAAGSGVAFLDDLNAASNTAYAYARTIGAAATNQDLKTSNTLWLDITNVYIAPGANVTVTTNASGQNTVYTIASSGGGGGAAGNTNITLWNNVNGTTQIRNTNAPQATLETWTESQVTVQTNFQMSSVGGAKMQRVYGGTTNGFMSVINARDYGLVSSGGDQTANLQAAITAATNSGLFSVYIPASTNVYTINGLIVPQGVHLFGDSARGTIGTGRGSTLYGNSQGKPMLVLSGANIEIDHIGLLDDGGEFGGVGILITNESSVVQDYSIHDVTMKGLSKGVFAHYTWGGSWVNNHIINCGYGMDLSNNINAMNFVHNYFANTNDVWLHGDSNYKNSFNGGNEFEASSAANFVSSNGLMMAGINQATDFTGNYVEKKTNGVVVNSSFGTVIKDNAFINCPSGTNIILVGASGPSVIGNRVVDQMPFIDVDSTTFGLTYIGNSVRSGASVTLNPITAFRNDNTNTVATGGSYYGPSINGGGLSQLADTNWVIAQFSSLGGLVYSSGVTNALVMTNNAAGENGYRTNIWQGQASVPTVITTNTINMVTATAGTYVRHYVSTNKYVTIGAGPVNVISYLFRSGAAGTVSGHYEIYAVDSVSGQMTELTSSTTHTIAETVPTLHQFTMSVPTDYTPANQAYIAVAFKLDTVVNGQTFNFVSGSNYDGHISFSRPLSSATITMSQVAGLAAALTDTTNNAAGSTNYTITATNQTFTYIRTLGGQDTNNTTQATNDLNTLVKTYTNETTLRAYVTNLDNTILTPATATNTMPLYGGFWRLVISTPAAITNLSGVTAGVYTYATCVFSNSLATTLTNRMLINAIASGYDATNSVAALGLNGFVIGAGKQVRLLVDAEGINQTNWMLIRQ